MSNDRDLVPFRFEDLPLNWEGERVEPAHWGPKYSRPVKPGKPVDRCPTNCASGQKRCFDAAKHRAKIRAEFEAAANADRRSWAGSAAQVEAYKQAMRDKRAREAAMLDRAA